MIPLNHYAASIGAALKLARFDGSAIKVFDTSPTGFWRSFHAAGFVLPFYIAFSMARWDHISAPISPLRFITVEAITYVIAWTVFPVLMAYLVRFIDREEHYVRGIVAFNWSAVVQNAVYTPIALASLDGGIAGPLAMIVLLAVLVYRWFVLRNAFAISSVTAWMLVGMDFSLGLMVTHWANRLIYG